jgi:hypothetical protein
MSGPRENSAAGPSRAGIPPGSVEAVISILEKQGSPMRRRKLLEALEQKGHRISLAGLNRVLQYCQESGRTTDGPEGVRLSPRASRAP